MTKGTHELGLGAVPKGRAQPAASHVGRALFGVLRPRVPNYQFLSLFSKDKTVNVRTLDHKTRCTMFIRGGPGTYAYVHRGLSFAGLASNNGLLGVSILRTLHSLRNKRPFSYVFVSTPCRRRLRRPILRCLTSDALTSRGALVIIRRSLRASFSCMRSLKCRLMHSGRCGAGGRIFLGG